MKSKCEKRKEFINKLFQPPEGTIPDYYHGNLIYRLKDTEKVSLNKKCKKEKEEDVERE